MVDIWGFAIKVLIKVFRGWFISYRVIENRCKLFCWILVEAAFFGNGWKTLIDKAIQALRKDWLFYKLTDRLSRRIIACIVWGVLVIGLLFRWKSIFILFILVLSWSSISSFLNFLISFGSPAHELLFIVKRNYIIKIYWTLLYLWHKSTPISHALLLDLLHLILVEEVIILVFWIVCVNKVAFIIDEHFVERLLVLGREIDNWLIDVAWGGGRNEAEDGRGLGASKIKLNYLSILVSLV